MCSHHGANILRWLQIMDDEDTIPSYTEDKLREENCIFGCPQFFNKSDFTYVEHWSTGVWIYAVYET